MPPAYAFFDVDGTVIATDSFLLIIREGIKRSPWRIVLLALCLPILIATGVFKLDRSLAKSALLLSITLFRGRRASVQFLNSLLKNFWSELWFVEATEALKEARARELKICFVSASGQLWLRQLLRAMDDGPKTIIGSRLGFFCGGVVLKSKNCYKEEKLKRIQERLGANFVWQQGYSDHIADIPMLDLCAERYVICPKEKHLAEFRRVFGDTFTLCQWHSARNR